MKAPRKELFETIIGKKVKKLSFDGVKESFTYKEKGGEEKSLNIHKFTNLCKVWGTRNDFYISSGMISDREGFATAVHSRNNGDPSEDKGRRRTIKESEPEAVIEAVEWCLDTIEAIKKEEQEKKNFRHNLFKLLKKDFPSLLDIRTYKKNSEVEGMFVYRVSAMFETEDALEFATFDADHADIRTEEELPDYLNRLIKFFFEERDRGMEEETLFGGFYFETYGKGADRERAFERQRIRWERDRLRGTYLGMVAESMKLPEVGETTETP